jgi:predicted enzyme related to lactoylglutathione lyase
MKNPVGWFEIYVEDMKRAKKFYETVFDMQMGLMRDSAEMEMWGFPGNPKTPGSAGSLVRMPGLKPAGVSTIVYFMTEDCSITAAAAEKAGGKIFKPKMSIGEYGFISLVNDTEGNMIGLHSQK